MSAISLLKFITKHPLNAGRPVTAIARFVAWQIRSRLTSAPLVCGWVNGVKLRIRRGETGLTGNIYTGLHEFTDMGFLLHFLRPQDLFVDIGANSGSYTVLAAASLGASCISFEPVPSTYQRLLDNVNLNDAAERVCALNLGLGPSNSVLRFTCGEDTTNHTLAKGEEDSNAIDVPVKALDDVLAGEVPALLKMDVEGFETAVVDGGSRTFANVGLAAMIIELNGSGSRYGYDEIKLRSRLLSFGFVSCTYDPFKRELSPGEQGDYGNTIFVRDMKFARERLRSAPPFTILDHSI